MEVAPSFGMYFAVLGDFMCYSPVPEGKSCVGAFQQNFAWMVNRQAILAYGSTKDGLMAAR